METKIISGSAIASQIRSELRIENAELKNAGKRVPKLAVVLVGSDPASEVYVRNKSKACEKAGILHDTILLPEESSEEQLLEVIEGLNEDPSVDGILVQLPLPKHICEERITQAIRVTKDVDAFHIVNGGKLALGIPGGFTPCTPTGVVEILKREGISIAGKHCVIVGRSNLVGKPEVFLMLAENATVSICHSKTPDLGAMTRQADILVVAAGKAKLINGSMIKEGAVVIDVGINRMEDGLVGDVDTESCLGIASAITPVPGGVGPMTIAMLLKNTMQAYRLHEGLE